MAVSSNALYQAIKDTFGLPAAATEAQITLRVGQPVEVTCTFHPTIEVTALDSVARKFELAAPITRRYMLEEVPAAAVRVAVADPLVTHPSGELDKEIVRKAAALAVEQIKQAQRRGLI